MWGFPPKCPYFMMRFREHPLFPNCFQGQSYFCVDTGGLLSNALTSAFGMSIEWFWTAVSLAVEITNRCLAAVAPAQTHAPQPLCSQFESVPFI